MLAPHSLRREFLVDSRPASETENPKQTRSTVRYVHAVNARERQAIIKAIVRHSGSSIESFFRSHGLGGAYARRDGSSKEQKTNDALAAAERAGTDTDELLRDAVRHFGLADEPEQEQRITAAPTDDSALLTFARLERLHPGIKDASAGLYRDGHRGQAIFEAFKAVEVRVKELSGLDDLIGRDLMAQAFRDQNSLVKLNAGRTLSERNEQKGFKLIFMGATRESGTQRLTISSRRLTKIERSNTSPSPAS